MKTKKNKYKHNYILQTICVKFLGNLLMAIGYPLSDYGQGKIRKKRWLFYDVYLGTGSWVKKDLYYGLLIMDYWR